MPADVNPFLAAVRAVTIAAALAIAAPVQAADSAAPTLEIVWPQAGSVIPLGADAAGAVGVVVRSNFALRAAGACDGQARCGHIHMTIDPDGDGCNLPGKPYNSMNSDHGGDLIKANFGACKTPVGEHVIGVLLADDHHRPVLVDGKPVTATVKVTTTR